MNKPVIGITGTSGFVGSALVEYFTDKGFPIICLSRSSAKKHNSRYYDMEQPVPEDLLKGIDILIHCAFIKLDENIDAEKINYEASRNLFFHPSGHALKKKIFFSTVSAHDHAVSSYGRGKYAAEHLFEDTDVILKCGLIVGEGGMFKQIFDHALTKRIIPLLDSGIQPMQVIALEDVLKSVDTIITNDLKGKFVLANNDDLNYREFFTTIAKLYNRSFMFIPIPVPILRILTRISNVLGIKLPFTKENISGLQALKKLDAHESLGKLNLQPKAFSEILLYLKRKSTKS